MINSLKSNRFETFNVGDLKRGKIAVNGHVFQAFESFYHWNIQFIIILFAFSFFDAGKIMTKASSVEQWKKNTSLNGFLLVVLYLVF